MSAKFSNSPVAREVGSHLGDNGRNIVDPLNWLDDTSDDIPYDVRDAANFRGTADCHDVNDMFDIVSYECGNSDKDGDYKPIDDSDADEDYVPAPVDCGDSDTNDDIVQATSDNDFDDVKIIITECGNSDKCHRFPVILFNPFKATTPESTPKITHFGGHLIIIINVIIMNFYQKIMSYMSLSHQIDQRETSVTSGSI